jgi:hypothetical protein
MTEANGKMELIDATLIDQFQVNIKQQHQEVSNIDTPKYFVKDKGGMDYVEEHYMRQLLNDNFPIWNWEVLNYEFLGDAWIVVHGRLSIVDNGVKRHFDSLASHRIQKKKTDGAYVDIGNDIKSANTDAFKVAVNRLCNISDDVYRKRVEDISLSEEQLSKLDVYLEQLDEATANKIRQGIEGQTINSANFDATIRKIESIIKGDK